MTPEVERFLDSATRELESDPELRDEAKGELMARLSHERDENLDDLASELNQSLEGGIGKKFRKRATVAILVLCLMVLGFGITVHVRQQGVYEDAGLFDSFHRYGKSLDISKGLLIKRLKKSAPGLPFGLESERFDRPFHESEEACRRHPQSLPVFREHVVRSLGGAGGDWEKLPLELKKRIEERDPNNGLWPLLRLKHAMDQSHRSYSDRRIDREALKKEALECWEEYRQLGNVEYPTADLATMQVGHLASPEDFLTNRITTNVASVGEPPSWLGFAREVVEVEANRLAMAEDKEGLILLSKDWRETVTRELIHIREYGHSLSWYQNSDLHRGLMKLKLDGEMKLWDETNVSFMGIEPSLYLSDPEKDRSAPEILRSEVRRYGQVIRTEELKPLRLAEYALADRLAAIGAALISTVFLAAACFESGRRQARIKGTAEGLMSLLTWRDHLWIGGLGLLLPGLLWLVVRISPLGLRQYGIHFMDGIPWLIQTTLSLVFCLSMLVATVRWRWAKRGRALAIVPSGVKTGWLAAATAGLTVPMIGIFQFALFSSVNSDEILIGICSFGGFALLWLVWVAINGLFQPMDSSLRSGLVARTLIPWFAITGIVMISGSFVLHELEKHWFRKDVLLRWPAVDGCMNQIDERVAEVVADCLGPLD